MITFLNSSNAAKYHILFDKAANLLKEAQPSALTSTLESYDLSWDNFTIGSLNEYFAYLQDLINVASTEDEKRFFVRLPLDEDVFAINADTREVTVPNSFSNYGVGVQGDEMAEVVYFTIDRYFDSTDLANDDIHIAIQWEVRNSSGVTVQGFSKNFGKDIESIPGKIIFGWPISHELTEAAGSIRFAVRFYSISAADDAGNQSFTYSFTTLPASVRINASLDYDVIQKTVPEIDHGQIITSRIRNSGIYNPSMPIPSAPIVTTELYVKSPEGNETYKIVDLPADESGIVLAIGAQPADNGVVGYIWKKYGYDSVSGQYNSNSAKITTNIADEYAEVTSIVETNEYYTISSVDPEAYGLLNIENLDPSFVYYYSHEEEGETYYDANPEDGVGVGFKSIDGGSYIKVFTKINTVTVNSTGIYTADVFARALVNTTTKTMNAEDGIKIPGPLKPAIALPEATAYVSITEEDNGVHAVVNELGIVTLEASAMSGEEKVREENPAEADAIVGVSPVVALEYQWQKQNESSWDDVAAVEGSIEIDDETNSLMLLGMESDPDLDEVYRLAVTSTRNGVSTTDYSGDYRVTQSPVAPVVRIRSYNSAQDKFEWVERNYQSANNNNKMVLTKRAGVDLNLSIGVDPEIKSDDISYIWMRMNLDNDNDIVNGETKLQIDLADEDSDTNTTINEVIKGITSIFENKPGNRDFIVQELNKFSDVVSDDEGDRYQTSYAASETGIYYCVVINELNNHINANASPFFIVAQS